MSKTQFAILRKDGFLSSHPNWTREMIGFDLKAGKGDADAYLWKGARVVEICIVQPKKKVRK